MVQQSNTCWRITLCKNLDAKILLKYFARTYKKVAKFLASCTRLLTRKYIFLHRYARILQDFMQVRGGSLNTDRCNFKMLIYIHIPTNSGHVGPVNVCNVIGINSELIA